MSSVYRPSTPEDEAQIIELLSRAFSVPTTANFIQPDLIRWKFWEPCEDWPEPRSWVVERDQQIVAHASVWPVTVRNGEKIERGISMIDWASDLRSAGAGVLLMKRMLKTYAFVYSIGGSAMTQALGPRLGYRVVAEAVTWSRPLRPWKRLLQNRSLSPRVALRLGRNVLRAQIPSKSVGRRWTVVEVNAGSWDPPVPSFERGQGFFDYLDRCPAVRCLRFHILNEGRKVGWFALVVGQIQARLAGMWLEDPTAENWRTAFNLAQNAALERTGAWEFAARCSTASSAVGAAQAGMHVTKRSPVNFRSDSASEPPPLQYQFCDNDDAFLNIR